MKILLTINLLFVLSATIFGQNVTSIFTSLETKACKTLKAEETGAGSYQGECKGIGGYKLQLFEGDLRQTISVIAPNRKEFELNFWSFFSSFSAIGEKAEWRVNGKNPIALINRFNVSDSEGSGKSVSYLMVTKITKKGICVTDIVKPSKNQNVIARTLADQAATKPCKSKE